jgi:hypothetical protein
MYNNLIITVLIATNINIIYIILNIINNNKILFVSPSPSNSHVTWPKNCLYVYSNVTPTIHKAHLKAVENFVFF